MTPLKDALERVEQADSLGQVLDAAYDAFAGMLSAIYGYHDAGGTFYPALMLATGPATDGRNALAFAPSLPPPSRPQPAQPPADPPAWPQLAASVSDLSYSLACKLRLAALATSTAEDLRACLNAANYADEIRGMATGNAG